VAIVVVVVPGEAVAEEAVEEEGNWVIRVI